MLIAFTLNGEPRQIEVDPFERASRVLASRLAVQSVKTPCGIGRCGACITLIDGQAVNACLVLAAQLDGANVATVEGLGTRANTVVAALERHGAIQCGYCAPGLLVSLVAAMEQKRPLGKDDIETLLAGNLCRCTGYVGIRRAASELLGAAQS
jgi:aerobic carbon-monoxide dehydrogenase small subunit